MENFELGINSSCCSSGCSNEECIIAYKIYDQCRYQICLTPSILGPARASKCVSACGELYQEGDIIIPPNNAVSVSMRDFELSKICIASKSKNEYRTGYWDVEVRYTFTYTLIFRNADGVEICCVPAMSVYTATVTLFGSSETDIVMSSDLYCSELLSSSAPYVTVEGKAVALASEIKYRTCTRCSGTVPANTCCSCDCEEITQPVSVNITIGLFTIIKIFRPINLMVHTSGICMPSECEAISPAQDPCEYFNGLTFPMDVFSPPGNNSDCACANSCGNSCSNTCPSTRSGTSNCKCR